MPSAQADDSRRWRSPDDPGTEDPIGETERSDGSARTVADHLSNDVPVLPPELTAPGARAALIGHRFESAAVIAVCVDGVLHGLVSIEDLLAARDEDTLGALMNPDPAAAGPATDQEVGAFRAVEREQIALPVVTEQGRFVGLMPPRRVLSVLRAEHESDLARIGGYLHDAARARTASTEPTLRRLAHRLPWLLLGLLGAIASAGLVGSFEGRLQESVALAFFLPGVVYLADAVGTQTEAVIIRGLSVGVGVRAVIWREVATGLLIGIVLAGLFLPFALLYGDPAVAATASLALFAACSIAGVLALLLPWLLQRLGRDPAFGSGPLATVLQDLASIAVYLGVALLLVR